MQKNSLVSVIITTHNRTTDIVLRAIHSVEAQTYGMYEIILVDDSNSTFEYRDELKSYILTNHKDIRYIQNEHCLGACVARNIGLNVANGEYVAFLDDDDEWLPNKLATMMVSFEHDNEVALVYCNELIVYDESEKEIIVHRKNLNGYVYEQLLMTNYIGSTSIPIIKKSRLLDIGGFDPLMESAQDYDVWLRLSKKNKICFVDVPLIKYHIHSGEQISKNIQKRINGLKRLYDKNIVAILENDNVFWKRNIIMAPLYAEQGNVINALKCWCKAVKKNPYKVYENIKYLFKIVRRAKKCKKMKE